MAHKGPADYHIIPQTELAMRGSNGVGLEGAMKSLRECSLTRPPIFAAIYNPLRDELYYSDNKQSFLVQKGVEQQGDMGPQKKRAGFRMGGDALKQGERIANPIG